MASLQVTLGYSTEFGVARMLVCDYQNAWTFVPPSSSDAVGLRGELLTAGYLQPTDPSYFDVATQPVVIFSHKLRLTPAIAQGQPAESF
jgi:hypothetical protein